jgi:hypothetical protein
MSNFNSQSMVNWLRAMVMAMPHGGKKEVADMLGLSPSGLSKLLSDPERGFDEKTLRAVAWVETTKASRYPEETFPIIASVNVGPLVVETRQIAEGTKPFYTWRLKDEPK